MARHTKNIMVFFQKATHRLRELWRIFLLTPARYWKQTLLLCVLLLVLLIAADAFIFWRYFVALNQGVEEQTAGSLSLNTKALDTALVLLEDRNKRFKNTTQTTPFRRVFPDLPQE